MSIMPSESYNELKVARIEINHNLRHYPIESFFSI